MRQKTKRYPNKGTELIKPAISYGLIASVPFKSVQIIRRIVVNHTGGHSKLLFVIGNKGTELIKASHFLRLNCLRPL